MLEEGELCSRISTLLHKKTNGLAAVITSSLKSQRSVKTTPRGCVHIPTKKVAQPEIGEVTMLAKRTACLASPLALLLAMGAVPASAQQQPCFSLASLQGSYSVVGTYGANIAIALAKRYLDADGNLTGTFVVNEPTAGSTTGARTLVTGTQQGTVSINCDGTGVVTRTLTVAGVQTTQMDDFVVTEARFEGGEWVATTIVDAQRTPSTIVSGGVFLRRTWTRVPDEHP